MIKKKFPLLIGVIVLFLSGCIKDTYDMNKLSKQVHLTPTMAIAAVTGGVTLSDIVKANDTIVFDQNKLVKAIFKKDSIVNLKLSDFYDLSNMVGFTQTYTVGTLTLAPFSGLMQFSLGQISARFNPALTATFAALDNGSPHPFPSFPSTTLPETTFTGITNFESAVFQSGFIDITIKNNLTAPLNAITVNLYNSTGHTAIGTTITIPAIAAGGTQTGTLSLSNTTVTNSIIAAITLGGSTGNATPVTISLNNSNIQLTISGRSLVVKSGRVTLPPQTLSLTNLDTINFNPGTGVELQQLKTTTGNISYHIQSTTPLSATLALTLPTAIRNSAAVSKTITIGSNSIVDGTIPFDNTVVDLNKSAKQPYNKVPVAYSISVTAGSMVTFNSTDKIQLDLKMQNPVFDYVKGYFGQTIENINPDSLDLDIQDALSHVTGTFLISNPIIRINYSNSFAIPMQVTFNGTGIRKNKTNVNLGLLPINITPATFASRDVSSVITVDKNNSSLPALISMPPEKIRFSGSAKMNPSGNNGLWDNYIFGSSRFLGSLEVEVPLEFRMNNFQFLDTINNFLKDSNSSSNSFSIEDFKLLRVDINAQNGFPVGISVKMSLYDSVTKTVKSTVDATDLLKAAPVDANGKSNGTTQTSTQIEITQTFFNSIKSADKVIISFGISTSDSGTKDVKIYSDNRIDYNIAVVAQPDIKTN